MNNVVEFFAFPQKEKLEKSDTVFKRVLYHLVQVLVHLTRAGRVAFEGYMVQFDFGVENTNLPLLHFHKS